MKMKDLSSRNSDTKEPYQRKAGIAIYKITLSLILPLYCALTNLVTPSLASTGTNFRIVLATSSGGSVFGCRSGWDGNIIMNWFKATDFDYFDEIDTSFNGTGVVRANKGQGCLAVVPDQWYWMALVSTRINTTHCEMKAMLRETTATDDGVCIQSSAGVSIWDALFPDGTMFEEDVIVNYPLNTTHGYGQEYSVTNGDEDLGEKNWSWLVHGLRYWDGATPSYLGHFSNIMLEIFLPANPHLEFQDVYNRMTKYEHVGILISHIPFVLKTRDSFSGVPGLKSYGTEFIINNLEDFSFNTPTTGERQLNFKFKVDYIGNEVADWLISFNYDTTNSQYVANISVDISTIVLTGSVSVDSVGTTFLNFFIAFGLSPFQGNLNNIKYFATFKMSNGIQTESWNDYGVKTSVGIWSNVLYTKMSQNCEDLTTSSNCSLTHDFGLTAVKYQHMSGCLDRSQVPSYLWETNNPTHDTKC